MTDKRDPTKPEEPPTDQRSDVGTPTPQEADALLLENLSPFLDPHGPPPHDPPSASDTASWRYDDHGMPLHPRRRNRIVRVLAPVAFLVLVVALVTVVLQSGVMNRGSSSSPSVSPSGNTTAAWTMYKVKKGDTLSAIALKKHTNTNAILDLNPGLSENSLSVGQKIKVPKASPSP